MQPTLRPRRPILLDVPVEDLEDVASEFVSAVAEEGSEDLVPALGRDLRRVVGHEAASRVEGFVGGDGQPRPHVLAGRQARPRRGRHPPQLIPRERDVAAPVRHHAGYEPASAIVSSLECKDSAMARAFPGLPAAISVRTSSSITSSSDTPAGAS